MKSPEEVANSTNSPEKISWLLESTREPREIIRFLNASAVGGHNDQLARSVLQVRISEIAELSTRRVVRLTWALVALTFALLIFTVYLYKDTHALVEREQAAQPHEAKHP